MLTAEQESYIAGKIPVLNNLWLSGYAQIDQQLAQYAIGGPVVAGRRAALDNDGARILTLATVRLIKLRNGDGGPSFEDWAVEANNIEADIAKQVDFGTGGGAGDALTGALEAAAAAAKDASTGAGFGIGLGLVILGALWIYSRR